jgi:ribosomal protein S18 acetylase RimI-like enzyme
MDLQLAPASDADLAFACDLTRRAMLPYYSRFDLLWSDDEFAAAWHWRDNRLVKSGGEVCGYISLSEDSRALYVRELHLLPAACGQGLGSQVLDWAVTLAASRGLPRVRLLVFKGNPAQSLYRRKGFVVVGGNDSVCRMERCVDQPDAPPGTGGSALAF